MLGKKAVINLREPERSFLLDLSLFPSGPTSILDRIPDNVSGMYVWFRSFHYPEDPDLLLEALMRDILAPKFHPRRGPIKPFYEVAISSKSWFSSGKKAQLKAALTNETFRRGLLDSLSLSVLFQAPLYIGKSIDIKERVRSHIKDGSPLRERLSSGCIALQDTVLLIVPNPESINEINLFEKNTISDEDEDYPYDNWEIIYEEIFSRLFNPLFTIRIG